MELLHTHCAGLDVHKKTVVACVRHHMPDGTATREVRTFATTTQALIDLAEWLSAEGCTSVTRLHGELVAEHAPVTYGMVRSHIATLRGAPSEAPPRPEGGPGPLP